MRVPGGVIRLLGLCLLAGVLLAGVLAPTAIGVGSLSNQVTDSVDSISTDFTTAQVPQVTTVTDRDGKPIAYLYSQYRLPVSYQQISPNMVAAIVDVEDKRFFSESGVDLKGTLRAALNNSSGGATQGASTITQQYVKNYLINVVDRNNPTAQQQDQADSVARKIRQAKIAQQLDSTLSKDDILTGYLNVVEFGSSGAGPFGVEAAAQAYFGVSAAQLTVPQAALLAGMVNNPVLYDPYKNPQNALQRRNLVLQRMVQAGSLSEKDAQTYSTTPLGVRANGPVMPSGTCYGAASDAGFFCAYALEYLEDAGFTADQLATGGYTIKTTMDSTIAAEAKTAVDNRVPTTQNGVANTLDIVQPGTTSHQVLALVANRNYGTDTAAGQTTYNLPADVIDAFGSGSTFKLFTLAAALETGNVGLNDSLSNPNSQCFTYSGSSSCYSVHNNDGTPDPISVRQALADSPNTAFVGLELKTGMTNVLDMAYRLGMRRSMTANVVGNDPTSQQSQSQGAPYNESQLESFQNSPSFTLGTAAISPLELANVGATLDSGGVWCPANPILSVTDRYGTSVPVNQQPCEQVISKAQADTMMNGMSEDTTTGTGANAAQAAGWTRPTAAKTGTTQVNKSVAFLGIVDNYAASSIVFADGKPAPICATSPPRLATDGACPGNAFGGTVAAPTFFTAFNQILAGQPDVALPNADSAYLEATAAKAPVVPYVVFRQRDAAVQKLRAAGYQVVTKSYASTEPAGQVVGQNLQSNVPTGTTITLYISTGSVPRIANAQPPNASSAMAGEATGSTGNTGTNDAGTPTVGNDTPGETPSKSTTSGN